MNEVENKAIKDQIYFERYKNGEANKVIELLDKSNKELAKYIKQTTDISSKKRYTEIARKLRDVAKTLKQDVKNGTDIDGLIDYELKRQKSLLKEIEPEIKRTKGGAVNFLYPSREQIKTSALFKPIDTKTGLTYQSYLENLESGLYNTWDSALRTGYLTGMPTKEIVDYVVGKASQINKLKNPGTMNAFRNSVYANTRTMLQSFANETMQRVYEENEQYFGDGKYKYEYLATLDSRTCLVCGECDGKLYKKLEDCPRIPQHRGCRCVIIPYFNIEGDRRVSKDGYVEDKVTYDEWLRNQDEETKLDVLGRTRYNLFKDGVRIEQFIDNGSVVPLARLVEDLGFTNLKNESESLLEEQDIITTSIDVTKRKKEIKITKEMSFEERRDSIVDWVVTNGLQDKCEYRVLADRKNNIINITKGEEHSVGYSEKLVKKILKYPSNSIIEYHNHNSNSAPSFSDLSSNVSFSQFFESIISTKHGQKYSLQRGSMKVADLEAMKAKYYTKFNEYKKKLAEEAKAGTLKSVLEVKNKIYTEKLLNDLMAEFGYNFIKLK